MNRNFSNNLIQALSSRKLEENYSKALLLRSEALITQLLRGILSGTAGEKFLEDDLLAHTLFMAQDGFAINIKLNGGSRRVDATAEMLTDMLLHSPK